MCSWTAEKLVMRPTACTSTKDSVWNITTLYIDGNERTLLLETSILFGVAAIHECHSKQNKTQQAHDTAR